MTQSGQLRSEDVEAANLIFLRKRSRWSASKLGVIPNCALTELSA
jgi:hypothetical protein